MPSILLSNNALDSDLLSIVTSWELLACAYYSTSQTAIEERLNLQSIDLDFNTRLGVLVICMLGG